MQRNPYYRAVLKTPRLLLRFPRPSDAEDLYAFCRDPRCSRYSEWSPHESLSDSKDYLRYLWRRRRWLAEIHFCMAERATGRVIGTCSYVNYDLEHKVGTVGYCVHPRYWRQGIATEAVTALLGFGFQDLKLMRVEARVLPENVASAALLQKLGFTLEGRLRNGITLKGETKDVLVFGITVEDFARLYAAGQQ